MPKLKRLSHSALKDVVLSRRQHFVASKREQNGLSVHAKELGLPVATVKNSKFGGYDVLPKLVSTCHNAPVRLGGDTSIYYCQRCGKICDTK